MMAYKVERQPMASESKDTMRALANGRTSCWEVWRGTKRLSNCIVHSFVHCPSVSLNKFLLDAFSLKVEVVFYKVDDLMICFNCEHWYAVALAVQLVLWHCTRKCFFSHENMIEKIYDMISN